MVAIVISVIIPVYNEVQNIPLLYRELSGVLQKASHSYEIIFIDDGSRDGTGELLERMEHDDKHLRVFRFRRNLGKSAALNLGFREAKGDIIFTMDGDLQDDPNEIPRFIAKITEGYDLVSGWKKVRRDPIGKRIPSKIFNWLVRTITKVPVHDSNCGFKAYRAEVTHNLKVYGELHRYIPSLVFWKGYKVTEIPVHHRARKYGKSKFGFSRLIKGFLDLLTIRYLVTYQYRPMHFFGTVGILSVASGTLLGLVLAYLSLIKHIIILRPLLFLALLLVIVGMQLFSTGLLGEMIAHSNENSENDLKGCLIPSRK
ncbi:MAG: glycosyltransferase family 2 protein [Candidatus Woesearchaeota archaeon]